MLFVSLSLTTLLLTSHFYTIINTGYELPCLRSILIHLLINYLLLDMSHLLVDGMLISHFLNFSLNYIGVISYFK
jgi:hypothetical protein